ncbi:MAG: peptidoglycan DD-metalloendopeptidase family protein [Bacteroidales bacterium]
MNNRRRSAGRVNGLTLVILAFSLCLFIAIACNTAPRESISTEKSEAASAKKTVPENLLFGLPADSFFITNGHIRPNRFLSEILGEYGISMTQIDQLVKNSAGVFDVKDLRAWHNYTVFSSRDSARELCYFVYEHDPVLSYIFSFRDSLGITPFSREVRSEIRFSTGVIKTSLWDAMMEGGMNPELAVDMADIYAWTVDFFGLSKGDRFKVIYEERYIDTVSVGIGKIYGAVFYRTDTPIYAIPVIQNGKESYYDSDGKSLRKAFLKAPLRFTGIGSRFSSARMHPILRIVRPHYGVDYSAPYGTPVFAIGDGTVISAGFENESGRIIRLRHNSVYTTAYLHLSGFAKGIRAGAYVKQGDVIGYVGSTGLSTGPHLDFRFYKNGSPVDPLKIDAPPVEPVLPENIAKFGKIKEVTIGLLNSFN